MSTTGLFTKHPKKILLFLVICMLFYGSSLAGEADVIKVDVKKSRKGSFGFSVTVQHADTGWDHYANKWDIVGEKDVVYGTRILHHPHVGEQPFTRGLYGIKIPDSVKNVTIRAHDSVHEYGGKVVKVELP